MGKQVKVLVSKPGLDGHDVGAKVVARALADAGFEVIYSGLHQTPESIAAAARDEDVDVIGMSVLSGAHVPLCQAFAALRKDYGLEDKLWIVGGNIPHQDRAALEAIGVDGVFATASKLDEIAAFIKEKVA